MLIGDIDRVHPRNQAVRRGSWNSLRMFFGFTPPLPTLDEDVEGIRIVRVDAFPLARFHPETLDDDPIVFQDVLSRKIGIIQVSELGAPPWGSRCGSRLHGFERRPQELDRRGAGV